MTRLYDPCLLCVACRRPGPNGWLYQCTQDREDLIEHAVCRGEVASFDVLGQRMSEQLRIRKGSPAARENRLSLFDEMRPEQMASYRPDQIATLLRQRENAVIQLQRLRNDSPEIVSHRTYSTAFEGAPGPFEYRKPWIRTVQEECQYRVCPRCRPALSDRAFLSLNAVADGEIPPTAAVGFGFHTMGERPVFDVEMIQNLGTGAPITPGETDSLGTAKKPLSERPLPPIPKASGGRGYFRSSESIRQLFGKPTAISQLAEENSGGQQDQGMTTLSHPLRPPPGLPLPGRVQRRSAEPSQETKKEEGLTEKSSSTRGGSGTGLESESSMGNAATCQPPRPAHATGDASSPSKATGQSETQPADSSPSPRVGSPDTSTKFASSPLKVEHGVAMLEESVELGVPDVVTHA
ncbi:hypothetical protein XA68_14935 [Ophiocordyceps unilateralis]|uniref:Uncharacterized protein n=1 Tax=Ophiocordyceps unilateralis TaxID=268505 RepID=A0A2A9PTI5_OPHUN|nr:hypothetical protein XA68_14935 [Ophiocordyceps unilateralis]